MMNRFALHPARPKVSMPRSVEAEGAAVVHPRRSHVLAALLLAAIALPAGAAVPLAFSAQPLFLKPPVNPNVLVMFDNSQSMDATMAGRSIQGDDPASRTSIARRVLRDVITTYRYDFNWGLGTFELRNATPSVLVTYAYYLGTDATMLYTNTCNNIVDGVGISDIQGSYAVQTGVRPGLGGFLPCIQNREFDTRAGAPPNRTINGYRFITFSRSADDPDVNDVGYFNAGPIYANGSEQLYGLGVPSNNPDNAFYKVYRHRVPDTTDWKVAGDFDPISRNSFRGCVGENKDTDFSPVCAGITPFKTTDSGFLPRPTQFPNQVFVKRGYGFNGDITGYGAVIEPVVNSQVSDTASRTREADHYANLQNLLAQLTYPQDFDALTPTRPIKNAAVRTPLAGALERSRNYFSGTAPYGSGAYATPARLTCQSNYVVLATDGNPTGKKDGTEYSMADRTNTQGTNGTWSFGAAARDVFTELEGLRNLRTGNIVDGVRTFVVGMGETLANAGSVAVLNEMASRGGTGSAYLASNSGALSGAFQQISDAINIERTAAGASVALNSTHYQQGSLLYQATFSSSPTWTGDLAAYAVDATGSPAAGRTWLASTQIGAQDWNTGRVVLTYRPAAGTVAAAGVPFRWPVDPAAPTANEIGIDQVAALNASPAGGADGAGGLRVAYLRGDASNEARNCNACALKFHDRITSLSGTTRSNVLGDIVNSSPLYVGQPNSGYDDGIESLAYSAFVASHSGRRPYLYVGANDGMLHAIDAQTGDEKFAYVPNLVYSALSRQTAQRYMHQFTVDGTPAVGDVVYGGAWHSLLVSGLRAGGKGLFALDVTDPSGVTEATAGSVVRWEISDPGLGHVFAQPALVKTNNGRWSVIVGNGYNASTATAQLFVIDAETGTVTKIDTGAGSGASPNGLSAVAPVDVDNDGTADMVYAGDLDGNLWKFDLTSTLPGSWSVVGGVPLFAAGAAKPITARPEVARHPKGGFIVTFATGRYLVSGDVGSTDTQTAYGIWDKTGNTAAIALGQLQEQKIEPGTVTATDGSEYRFSTHRVGAASDTVLADDLPTVTVDSFYGSKLGWYMDLPTSGERVVAAPAIRGNRAIFTSIIPVFAGSNECAPQGSGWITEVDLLTGNRLTSPTFDTNNDRLLDDSDRLKINDAATGTNTTTSWRINGIPSAPAFLTVGSGADSAEIKYVNTSGGTVQQKREGPGTGGQRRVMWRTVQ